MVASTPPVSIETRPLDDLVREASRQPRLAHEEQARLAYLSDSGVEALVQSARGYSAERDGPFAAHARRKVRAAMRRELDAH